MTHSIVHNLLSNFAEKIQGIRGLTLITDTGYPIIEGYGLEDSQPLIAAGRMLQTAILCQQEQQWETMGHISIRAKDGYFELIPCVESIFLIVYSTVQWSGFLEQEITQLVKQLRPPLEEDLAVATNSPILEVEDNSEISSMLKPSVSADMFKKYQQEFSRYAGPVAAIICKRIQNEYHSFTPSELINYLAQNIPSPQESEQFIEDCVALSLPPQEGKLHRFSEI